MKFLKEIAAHPKKIGAIAPSSKQLSKLIIDSAEIEENDVVVEVGPGTGVFTREILEHVSDNGRYIGVEINEEFVNHLRQQYQESLFHHGDAADIVSYLAMDGYDTCEKVISGLPWVNFTESKQLKLLQSIHQALSKDGVFVAFSYTLFHHLPRGKTFQSSLKKIFSEVKRTNTVLNLPPAFVYICRK